MLWPDSYFILSAYQPPRAAIVLRTCVGFVVGSLLVRQGHGLVFTAGKV